MKSSWLAFEGKQRMVKVAHENMERIEMTFLSPDVKGCNQLPDDNENTISPASQLQE
jgi:hypothetical protein